MSQILPFKDVFKQKIFRIPDYQRGYSWEQSQLEDLWADLNNIHLNNNAYHFTGILTINNFSSQDFDNLEREGFTSHTDREQQKVIINGVNYIPLNLVDGQQRLTTILILLSEAIKRLKDNDAKALFRQSFFYVPDISNKYLFGYHVDVPSHNYLIRNIFEDLSYGEEDIETLYTHNLYFAKNFFNEKLEEFSQQNLKDLITKITDKLLFSVLNLSESAGSNLDISMVFETLNFRGKQLSGLERFKNRVLYLLSKQAFGQERIANRRIMVNKTWLEVYKWLGRNPNPKKVMDDDAFLKAFWLLYFSKQDMVAQDFKSYQKNLFEKDFNLLNIHNNHYMKPDELRKWLHCMKESVILWYFINNPEEAEEDPEFKYYSTDKIRRSLLRLNSFPFGYGRYMLNLVLAVLVRLLPKYEYGVELTEDHERNITTIEQFLWAAERHNIMCYLLYGNKTNYNQEVTFRDINKYFVSGNSAQSGASLIEQLLNTRVHHFSWAGVRRNLEMGTYFYAWDGIYFILREYEEYISGIKVDREIAINRLYPEDKLIARKSYEEINKLGNSRRRKYSYALGNLFMSNNSHSDRSFKDHKDRIQTALNRNNTVYQSERQLLDYDSWTLENIEERSEKILNVIIEKWDIPNYEISFWKEYFAT